MLNIVIYYSRFQASYFGACALTPTVLCKSNDSEFRRISTKFYEILRKSAKFRGERIFGEISVASIVSPLTKFRADVRNFTWQIR